jgi:REP element-mobilizing transposase RayT
VPRSPRLELEGGVHHVITRGDHRERIFDDDVDRRRFLRRFGEIAVRYEWVPLSYCLMDNHVHLVVETPSRTLGFGCRDLIGDYARRRNAQRDEVGHVFQGRFHSRLVLDERYFAQLLRYVALNPVKAGVSATADDWPWSAHRGLRAGGGDPLARADRVSELLGVSGGPDPNRYPALFEPGNALAVQYGAADPGTWRPSLEVLLENGLDAGLAAAREHGYRLAEIGRHLGIHESTVCRRLKRKKGA